MDNTQDLNEFYRNWNKEDFEVQLEILQSAGRKYEEGEFLTWDEKRKLRGIEGNQIEAHIAYVSKVLEDMGNPDIVTLQLTDEMRAMLEERTPDVLLYEGDTTAFRDFLNNVGFDVDDLPQNILNIYDVEVKMFRPHLLYLSVPIPNSHPFSFNISHFREVDVAYLFLKEVQALQEAFDEYTIFANLGYDLTNDIYVIEIDEFGRGDKNHNLLGHHRPGLDAANYLYRQGYRAVGFSNTIATEDFQAHTLIMQRKDD